MALFFTIPFAYFFETIHEHFQKKHSFKLLTISIIFFTLLAVLPSFEDKVKTSFPGYSLPFFDFKENRVVRHHKEIAQWLNKNVKPDENIFVRHGGYNSYLYAWYAYWSKRRFINSPYNFAYIKHNYINRYFYDFFSPKEYKVNSMDFRWPKNSLFPFYKKDFSKIAKFFNVKWWVVYYPKVKWKIHRIDGMKLIKKLGNVWIYKYNKKMSNFIGGEGNIELDYNKIMITNIQAKDELILKFHWLEGMKVKGADKIEPYYIEKFPLPFIKISKPKKSVEIYYE